MSLKNNIDFKSVKFKLWLYFIIFTAVIIALIWLLQVFFLNTYYEAMKIRETNKIANKIIEEYQEDDEDLSALTNTISTISATNDVVVRIETEEGAILISPNYDGHGPIALYSLQVSALKTRLEASSLHRVSIITPGRDGTRTLSYACYLTKKSLDENSSDSTSDTSKYILYIFAPLAPVESTIAILRTQLIYITLISILLALALALYLASRISKPLKDITNSAAEMGKGNYGVTFRGGHYTEITELADTLTTASHELEKTDLYQKDLIANVSHDLRTPLTMIKSYAEMIRDLSGDNPEKRTAHLNVIIEEADRLNALVNDMLNMSRMQNKTIELDRTNFDLAAAVESLAASYDILKEQQGYDITLNCSGPFVVNGDEAKIKQVVSNLVTNAVKYCGEDKKIIINVKKVGRSKVRCEVIDHGKGIAPDEISHVWERYYKSSTNHVRPTEGSGLGLSIVKEILILHKAEYGVNSTPGKGSTFWFEMNLIKVDKAKGLMP